MSDRIKIFGMSDPLTAPTGFGRVARELFSRLSEREEFETGFISRNWVGTRRWPNLKTYVGWDEYCQDQLPVAVLDFIGQTDPYILWTLNDPWQVGWISNPGANALSTVNSAAFWKDHRERTRWIGHFPIDGWGPRQGPPLWVEDFLNAPDVTVFMSDFGRKVLESFMKTKWRVIKHALDTQVFRPFHKDKAKEQVEELYMTSLVRTLQMRRTEEVTDEQITKQAEAMRLRLAGHFVILVVMANRERKLWPQVLDAFKGLLEKVPEARLIGICGDRTAERGGTWPLLDYGRMLGLERTANPIVWLFDNLGRMPWDEDPYMALFNSAADVSVLLSNGEGFGLPQLEAHACGTPCIVGRYSASEELAVESKEMIEPRGYRLTGTNLVKWPIYRTADLVERLIYAARNPKWRYDVGKAAVLHVQREHDWSVILPQWLDLFQEVMNEPVRSNQDDSAGSTETVSDQP